MTLSEFAFRAGPAPWVIDGRDFAGWDCWGLIVCAFREVLGIELNDRAESSGSNRAMSRALAAEKELWPQVRDPQPMDVAVMNRLGRPLHVGLVLDRRRVLHAAQSVGTVIEPLFMRSAPNRIEGLYRHVRRA